MAKVRNPIKNENSNLVYIKKTKDEEYTHIAKIKKISNL